MRETGLRDVVFAGYASLDDLPRFHHSSQIFCAPNTGNESQGIILLEAMAAGLPVVASNIEGFAGVLTHGIEGLWCGPRTASCCRGPCSSWSTTPGLREEMGARGRERAQHFSWERVSQRVLSYYERLAYEKRLAGGRPELVRGVMQFTMPRALPRQVTSPSSPCWRASA